MSGDASVMDALSHHALDVIAMESTVHKMLTPNGRSNRPRPRLAGERHAHGRKASLTWQKTLPTWQENVGLHDRTHDRKLSGCVGDCRRELPKYMPQTEEQNDVLLLSLLQVVVTLMHV